MIRNLVLIITDPFALGKRIREKPSWVVPAILILVLTLAFTLPYSPKAFHESMEKLKIEKPELVQKMKEAGRWERMVNAPKKFIFLRTSIGLTFTYVMSLLITSLLLLLGLRFFTTEGNFVHLLSIYTYSTLINYPLASLIKDIIIYLKGTTMGVSTSLLLLFPFSPFSKAGRFLQAFDLMDIWAAAACGLALAGAFNLGKKRGLTVSLGVWFLKALIVGGLSLLF